MMKQTPATREQNMKRSIDITRIGHDTLDDEHKALVKAINEIYKFQWLKSDPIKKEVYQFMEDNQYMIEPHILTLYTASATIEPVVNFNKIQMFRTEILSNQSIPEMQTSDKEQDAKKEKDDRSWTEKLLNKPKKRIVSSDDPYRISIPHYETSMGKLDRIERFAEYQAYGVDLFEFAGYAGMIEYLRFHRTRFKFDVAFPLIRSHKQFCDIVKAGEKQIAGSVASNISHEIFTTRNDMAMIQKPPQS